MPTLDSILRSSFAVVSALAAGILSATPALAGLTCGVTVPVPSPPTLIIVGMAGVVAAFIRRRRK